MFVLNVSNFIDKNTVINVLLTSRELYYLHYSLLLVMQK